MKSSGLVVKLSLEATTEYNSTENWLLS